MNSLNFKAPIIFSTANIAVIQTDCVNFLNEMTFFEKKNNYEHACQQVISL